VALEAMGSNPIIHPIKCSYFGMSPSGKAPDFDSGIRRFESCHPSHIRTHKLIEQFVGSFFKKLH
jgi:hypothetical protein